MDLHEIGAPESELDLKYLGDEIGLKLHLRSPDDPAIRKAMRRIEGRMTRIFARRMTAQTKGEAGALPDPASTLDDDSADAEWGELTYEQREARALAAVTGWTWGKSAQGTDASWKGEKPAYDVAILRDMIDAAKVDIVGQVDAHLNSVALAQKKPKTPSQKRSG